MDVGGVMMISSPANTITWNEFWEPFQTETHVHVRDHGGRHHHHHVVTIIEQPMDKFSHCHIIIMIDVVMIIITTKDIG